MRYARIYPWRRTRRSRAPSSGPGTFLAAQFSAGCTTNISGFDLRQAQAVSGTISANPEDVASVHRIALVEIGQADAFDFSAIPESARRVIRFTPADSSTRRPRP